MTELKERFTQLTKKLSEGIHERDEVIAVSLLAALSGQNIFLYGPPGTAKSLISRRLSSAFKTKNYFEYLMQRFSTPEEVFGPVSIAELKKDNYIRKTNGFLPEADFAFLDEIWKSSPAILNTLLTVINEKRFKNGVNLMEVPLKVLISASNETPPENQGLEALYDRFLVRLNVPPMQNRDNFEALLQSSPTSSAIEIPQKLKISHDEWEFWQLEIDEIKLSKETLHIIQDIRMNLANKKNKVDVYASDRRWQKAAFLLKAAAFFCERNMTNTVDCLLLKHCLWTQENNREKVMKIVEDAVRNSGFQTDISHGDLDKEKERLDNEINKELYHAKNVYKTVKLAGNKQYFTVKGSLENRHHQKEKVSFYILYSAMKSQKEFHPVDEQGNEITDVTCSFDKQGSCNIIKEDYYSHKYTGTYTPNVLYHKGDKKDDVNPRLVAALKDAVDQLKSDIQKTQHVIKSKLGKFKKELDTPFVPEKTRAIALESIESQVEAMDLRLKDCERLHSLVGSAL